MTGPSGRDAAPGRPWGDQPYSVKRHGLGITSCDAEPVQTPGCIQAHGAMLVARRADLRIVQASENTARWLGAAPEALLGQPLAAALGSDGHARIDELLAHEVTDNNPVFAFALRAETASPLDVVVHTVDGVVVVELESGGPSPAPPAADHYLRVQRSVARLQASRTFLEFCQVVSDEVRRFTGLDRAMIYKFHADGHGEVFAESRRSDLAPWLGLHYPAEDIPAPAREVFRQIWIRPVPDVGAELAELVPLANPQTGRPLPMVHCVLRGPSVMYTEYLQNMRVTASLTMPIRRGDQLWGLIACHHYDGPAHFPWHVRAACELLAQVVSLQHEAAESREHARYRLHIDGVHEQILSSVGRDGELAALVLGRPNLLDALDAGGAALYHAGRWWCAGNTPSDHELDELAEWLAARPELGSPTRPVFATDMLAREYPAGEAIAGVASGVLAVHLSREARALVLWFRPEMLQEVRWAGHPDDKPRVMGPHGPRLTPRRSFELFVEAARLRAQPWRLAELDAVLRFRMLAMELVVGRAERLSTTNANLVRINEELDAFTYVASHDLKEPLRGIYKYAHQLLDEAVDAPDAQRKKLEGLMRLTVRMDSLLESLLHYSRTGRVTLELEGVDLGAIVEEALEMVGVQRDDVATDVVVPRSLPVARCAPAQVREVFCNLLSNALKYNDKPRRRIEIGYWAPGEQAALESTPREAVGRTVYYVRDNGIGIEPRHHEQVFKLFRRLHGSSEWGGGTGAGLTIVRRLIARHSGCIWLASIPGEGSVFYFTLEGDPP